MAKMSYSYERLVFLSFNDVIMTSLWRHYDNVDDIEKCDGLTDSLKVIMACYFESCLRN